MIPIFSFKRGKDLTCKTINICYGKMQTYQLDYQFNLPFEQSQYN